MEKALILRAFSIFSLIQEVLNLSTLSLKQIDHCNYHTNLLRI